MMTGSTGQRSLIETGAHSASAFSWQHFGPGAAGARAFESVSNSRAF